MAGFSGVWCAVLVVGAELPSEGAACCCGWWLVVVWGAWCGWGCPSLENCIVDASIFVVKLLRAHGGCLGTRSR